MTENKRFEMKDPNCWGYPITDNKTGTVYNCNSNIWMKELVGVLNALNDENEQLKHDATVLIQANQDYRKENEQLKQLLLQFYTEDEKECPLFDELDVLSNEMDMGFRVKLD